MSLHRSLKGSQNLGRRKNVLKLVEKIKYLIKEGSFTLGDNVFGLKKIKVIKLKKIKKEKKEITEVVNKVGE